jgi:hypothetical protein
MRSGVVSGTFIGFQSSDLRAFEEDATGESEIPNKTGNQKR